MKKLIIAILVSLFMQQAVAQVSCLQKNIDNVILLFYKDSSTVFEHIFYDIQKETYQDTGYDMCEFIGYKHNVLLCFDNNELTFARILIDKKLKKIVISQLDDKQFRLKIKKKRYVWLGFSLIENYYVIMVYNSKKGYISFYPIK